MKRFYFYAAVTYPAKNENEIPEGNIGIHYIDGENEEECKRECMEKYDKIPLYLVDMFGNEKKVRFQWYGEIKNNILV